MIVTKEQLEAIVNEYDKNKSAKEVMAFIDGIEACLKLLNDINDSKIKN